MTFEHKPNSGSLFVNDKRETDSHPNAKGSALIDGVEYWVSAWTNDSQSGKKYQKLSFQRKDEVREKGLEQAQAALQPTGTDDFGDSDIPF